MVDIIICSSSDMTPAEAKEKNLLFCPLEVCVGGRWFRDGVDISAEEFNRRLPELSEVPKTSQVPPETFKNVFEGIKDAAVVITVSSNLSGTFQSAKLLAEDFENIFVVDSQSGSVGERIFIERAITLRERGLSAKDLAEALDKEKKAIRLIGVLDTLKFLAKGGRLSRAQAIAGGVLRVKLVLALENGEIRVLGKARGAKKAGNFLFQFVEENGGIDFSRPIAIGYSGDDDSVVRKYIENSRILYEGKKKTLPVSQTGSVIGTHAGPGAALFAYFKK